MSKPKKSLGQNFLRDTNVLQKIIKAANLKADDFVIEIGPGEGILSFEILKKTQGLIMVEKDDGLAEEVALKFQISNIKLQKKSKIQNCKFQNNRGIISGDILEINLPELIEKNNFKNYKLVANIPYYITSPIIQLFLETKYPPTEMVLMVQKEVAERICASPGQMSILAASVQYYAEPKLLFYVDKKSFYPVPEVDSAVIKIETRGKNKEKSEDEIKSFFRVVKAGFSSKRKTLLNNLSNSLHLDRKIVEETIRKAGFWPTQRAQELSVEDWKKLTKTFQELDLLNPRQTD